MQFFELSKNPEKNVLRYNIIHDNKKY